MGSSRRTFIKQASGFTTACVTGLNVNSTAKTFTISPAMGLADSSSAGWYDRPMRWAQLAFVEDDPGNYDLSFWLNYFKSIHADAACLSAGGVVAFYPTEIPLHYRSRWLGTMDTFGDIVAGCRKLGMNVIARTDSHACHQDVYDAHPDWIAVDEYGNKRRHASDPEYWLTCALGSTAFSPTAGPAPECVTASTAKRTFATSPASTFLAPSTRRMHRGASTSCGIKGCCLISGGSGIKRSARSIRKPATLQMLVVAP
jgi:hypothetical protein